MMYVKHAENWCRHPLSVQSVMHHFTVPVCLRKRNTSALSVDMNQISMSFDLGNGEFDQVIKIRGFSVSLQLV